MVSVRERRPGYWEARAYIGRHPLTRKKDYRSTVIEVPLDLDARAARRYAERKGAVWEDQLLSKSDPATTGTFGDLFDRWFKIARGDMSPSTVKETLSIRARYLGPILDIPVKKLTTRGLDDLYAELRAGGGRCDHRPCRGRRQACSHEGRCRTWQPCEQRPCEHGLPLSAATVTRTHKVIKSALEQAITWDEIDRNPATRARPGKVVEDEIVPPTVAEVVRLIAAAEAEDPRFAAFIAVAAATGARRGAVLALRWHRLDLALGTARFPNVIVEGPDGVQEQRARETKRSGRHVSLDPFTVQALIGLHDACFERAASCGAMLATDALVFSDDPEGRVPWTPNGVSKTYQRLRDRAGLSRIRLHDLRHFMATQLLAAGIDPKTVASRGGWAEVATMFNRYTHTLPATDRAAAQRMGELLYGDGAAAG